MAVTTGSVMMVPVFSAHGDVMEQVTAWMDLMRWIAVCALRFLDTDGKLWLSMSKYCHMLLLACK